MNPARGAAIIALVGLALTPAGAPIDVALVFDQSASIRLGAPTVKRDARAFLDALDADDCAFVLPFQHRIGPGMWGPAVDPSLLQTIDLTPLEGGTSLNDALMVGLAEVQRWNVPDILAGRVITEYRQPTIVGGVGIDLAGGPAAAGTVHEHDIEVKVRRSGLDVFARSEHFRASSDTDTARQALRRGVNLALEGRLDEALAAASQAIVADAQLWDAHFLEAAVRAWREAIRAQLAGADMEQEMQMLAARSAPPEALEARLNVPRVFVEGDRSDDPKAALRLVDLARALSRATSESALLGLVRDPLAADYFLYIDAAGVDARDPRRLESRLELYNYTDQRVWRGDMNVVDIEDPEQIEEAAAAAAMLRLEAWLREGR